MIKTMLMAVALAVGLMAAAAPAATVTVDGKRWDITTVVGTFDALSDKLRTQPWWGRPTDDLSFATAVKGSLGFPNFFGLRSPYFAQLALPFGNTPYDIIHTTHFVKAGAAAAGYSAFDYETLVWAVATPAAIPLPAGGLLLLTGIAAAVAVGKRRRKVVA